MKTKLRKFGAGLLALALAFAGASAYGAITTQAELDAAVAAAKAGEVVEITAAGTYKMPSIPANITIKAASGVAVKIDATGSGSICGTTAGATFEGLEFSFGNTGYHGFQSGKALIFNDCTLNGLFFSYNAITFNRCTFNQTASEYMMWCYAGDIAYNACTFNGNGKFFNLYNEGNDGGTPWVISFDVCTFNSTKLNKAALNVKSTCGSKPMRYDVTVNNCTANGDNFPAASVSDTLIVFNGLIQLDDIKEGVDNVITITQDGKVLYADNAMVPQEVPGVEIVVEENSGKGITQEVVQEIVANEEIAKVEQTAIVEAIKEEVEGKDEAVVKVTLQEVKTEANKTTLQFEVAPFIGAVQVNNDNIKGAVPFRLPLLKEKFVEYAKISHEGDPDRFVLVKKGANGEPYVDVALTHFSTVLASVANEAEMVPEGATKIQDGLWGANGKTTIAEAEIVYIVGKTGLEAFRDWANARTGLDGKVFGAGKTFILVADVDLQGGDANLWTPIGTGDHDNLFSGTFDGNGRSIQNLCVKFNGDAGLFNEITKDGCIKDLTVASGRIATTTGNGGVGAVAGYMTGGRIENVINRAEIQAIGTYGRLGGVVGIQGDKDYGDVSVISNCVNYGKVWQDSGLATAGAGGHLGGIVGQCAYMLKVLSCENYGDVTADLATINVGGIIGNGKCQKNTGFPEEVLTVENCVNYGAVTTAGGGNIAGVICKFENGAKGHGTATKIGAIFGNCANYGELIGNPSSGGAGGGFVEMQWSASKVKLSGPVTVRKGQTFSNYSLASSVWDPQPVATCPSVAKDINGNDIDVDVYYTSIADAVAAAKEGDTVTLVSASSENFTLKVGVTFDASKAAYSGTISAPEGYFVKEVSTKVYECKPAVAQIGTKIYSSLAEAYGASVDGDTIKMLVDFALMEDFKLGSVDRNNLIIDLNGKKMTLHSVVSTQYKNLTFGNGAIDVGSPAGGLAGEHSWEKLFYVESSELKFDNVVLTYTNGTCTVGIQTGGSAKLTFKDSTLNFANCDKPIYLGTPGDCVFDHTVINADKATTYVVHGDYNCGPVIFKDGSSVTMKDCGGLNSNSTFEMSDTTVKATGLKSPLFNNCTVTLKANSKVDHSASPTVQYAIKKSGIVAEAGSELTISGVSTDGLLLTKASAIAKGAVVSVDCQIVTESSLSIAAGAYKSVTTSGTSASIDLKGGIYHDEPVDAFVNPYYEKVANTDEATKDAYPWAIAAKPSVAEMLDAESQSIGEIYSFELALAQVPENGTIKLLADASFAITDTSKSFKIDPNGKSVEGITLPYGYELKDNEGILTFRKTPIATITRDSVTTEFDSLAAACTTAQSGDVIQLAALEIDATDAYVIKDLTGKTVTVKGAGQDSTTLLWGTGLKYGTGSNSYLTGANITFEDLAVTIAHDSGMPYVQWMDHPASQTFRNVKINGLIVAMDSAVFDGCTFAGPQQNSAKGAPDEYLIWNYGNHVYVTNCTFAASGTHAPIKLYNDSGVKCSATVVDTTFAAVGDESGAITTASSSDDFAYDIQIDVNSVTVPAGATMIGFDPNYGSMKVNMVNGTTDANGKYTSGAIFSDRGTDEQILAIVAKIVAEGYTALPYTGSATVLGNYRWYIGPQQLQPKTDEAEADAKQETKEAVAEQLSKTVEEVQSDINTAVTGVKTEVAEAATSRAVTQFAGTGLSEAVVNPDGSLDPLVIAALKEGKTQEQQEKIEQLSSDSNSTKRIQIDLKKVDVGLAVAAGEAVVGSANEVTYDVEPRVKTVIEVKDEQGVVTDTIESDAKVPNETIADSPITFRLGVTWAVGEQVKVLRDDVNFGITYVKGEGDEHYVELTSNHFSSFKLMKVNVPTVCEVGGQAFESVADAVAASAGSPTAVIKLTAPCYETNLPLLWGQEIDVNGQDFTGSITPVAEPGSGFEASDYVQVKTPAGRVFSAPKQVAVPLDASEEPATIKVRIAGKTADELKVVQTSSGRPLWQDLAMGSTEKLIPQVLRSAIGSKTITIRGTISDEAVEAAAKVRDGVSVKYQLMKRVGSGAYAQFGEVQDKPVFTVEADELEVQTFWKIQTIFDEEY